MDLKKIVIQKISDVQWRIEPQDEMQVPLVVYGNAETISQLKEELSGDMHWSSLRQLVNVAQLPGVEAPVIAMADVHPGYGFPIGGVGVFDMQKGVISVAGVGFDCNCGVRMLTTPLARNDVLKQQEELANALFRDIPAGVGSKGTLVLNTKELDRVLCDGAVSVIKKGFGINDDIDYIEERGRLDNADPSTVSTRAKERQHKQVGTLGSGNHYLEVQYVDRIFDREAAHAFGVITEGQITMAIHCGSRALGHQVGTDYLKTLASATRRYGISIPDRELVCAPIQSPEAKQYLSALACAVNCAFANRQVLTHIARGVLTRLFGVAEEKVQTLYDVGHNNAKIERHTIQGKEKQVLIHRKGSTRALNPQHPDLPKQYRSVGQPILVGGTMGTASYILRGTEKGMRDAFGSAVHGAGRKLSRQMAKRKFRGHDIVDTLRKEKVMIKSTSLAGVAEEAPLAYKNVDEVVSIVDTAGINKKVARLKPLICIKG